MMRRYGSGSSTRRIRAGCRSTLRRSPIGTSDMISFAKGNLLEADVEAVVNTVNTVGVMGKGIALMFKERFPENFKAYEAASKRGEVQVGRMFLTASTEL